jgi:signal transduction histidine kinase
MIKIQVRDEGFGIPEDTIGRIIEPFFTTKLKTGGTGLGLSISYNIIKEHDGLLEFRSEQGKGTTATVTLPVN